MSLSERARNFLFFFGGIFLGIVGNLLVECIVAYRYPDGVIPPDTALTLIIGLSVLIAAEIIVVAIYTIR